MSAVKALFEPAGPLAREVAGYAPREVQSQMAQAVEQALEKRETVIIEAGTGTGKTFAYLVPALLSGRKVVISTGTLNLQDQLFHRDLPRVRAALKAPVKVALLKGRANYLCRSRLAKASLQGVTRNESVKLRELSAWMQRTESGELQEFGKLADDDPLIPRVTSTAENCTGSKCSDFENCFVVRARRNALAADVLVVNHHLLFADYALKEDGFGQILPGADAVIVDEAHQLPELSARFFGSRVSTRQLQDLAADCADEAAALGDVPVLKIAAAALAEGAAKLEAAFMGVGGRETFAQFRKRPAAEPALAAVREALSDLIEQLKVLAERKVEIAAAHLRAQHLAERIQALATDDESRIAWVEALGRGGSLHVTPIRVDEDFSRMREVHEGAWVFTSATLAAGEDFSHFGSQLGLAQARTLRLESPFDFEQQARLYLPRGLPEPSDSEYIARLTEAILPVIEASGGGVFVLCTSHRALRDIASRLRGEIRFPLLVQGDAARSDLLATFTAAGNAVLVGTASFWEGVDVRGLALRVVIIDKLPFAAPGDPVFEARLQAIRSEGGDPFNDLQVPQAIMTLRQGAGRLIRDTTDKGLLMLCDPRLRSRGYGRRILESLPCIPEVPDLAGAQSWLHQIRDSLSPRQRGEGKGEGPG